MSPPLRILLVDDRAADRELCVLVLERRLAGVEIIVADDAVTFAERLALAEYDVVVAERSLAWADGLAVLSAARRRRPDCALVLASAAPWSESPEALVAAGLDGALRKDSAGILSLPGLIEAARKRAAKRPPIVPGTVPREALEAARSAHAELARQADALRQSNQELEQLAYAVSHDLQQPLHLMVRQARMLAEGGPEGLFPERQRLVGRLVESARRMEAMIDGMLELSRVGSRVGNFEPVDFDGVVTEAIANLQVAIEASGTEVQVESMPRLVADRRQMVQLLQNLIANAVKFGPAQGPRVKVTARERGAEWLIAVQDNGIGMEPGQVGRIFGMFARLHTAEEYPGTGIGLALCKRIVERHRGRIEVRTGPGQGSTFIVILPKVQPGAGMGVEVPGRDGWGPQAG